MPPKKTTKVKKIKKKLDFPEDGISKPAIMRILYRAGVKSTSSLVYDEFRSIAMTFLGKLIKTAALYTNNRKKSTINEADVINSLKTFGLVYLGSGGSGNIVSGEGLYFKINVTKSKSNKRKTPKKNRKAANKTGLRKSKGIEGGMGPTHRFKSGTVSLRSIRRYQKSSEFLIRRSPVKYIIRSILDKINIKSKYLELNGSEFRIGSTSINAFQTALENHLVNIASRSLLLALNSKRTRLQVLDVKVTRRLLE